MKLTIDLRKSIPENAEHYYMEAKKARKKVVGAKKALEDTQKKIDAIEGKRKQIEPAILKKKKVVQKNWYDIFRHFKSSDGFLVVGGRDATTNEILVKKHVEKNDLVFHADVQGAPFFVIKNPVGGDIPENTLRETAEMAASYSKAWSAGWGSCDVYYVKPDQVSKTPPTGEYLPKGAFMIYGKKEWYRKTPLAVGVGFKVDEGVEVVGGPASAVEKETRHYTRIGPGDKKSKQLSGEIKERVLKDAGKEAGGKIKKTGIEEIQKWIPAGKGRVLI